MTSYIQEPFDYRHVSNPIQFVSPKGNEENHYLNRVGYISNRDDACFILVKILLNFICSFSMSSKLTSPSCIFFKYMYWTLIFNKNFWSTIALKIIY